MIVELFSFFFFKKSRANLFLYILVARLGGLISHGRSTSRNNIHGKIFSLTISEMSLYTLLAKRVFSVHSINYPRDAIAQINYTQISKM